MKMMRIIQLGSGLDNTHRNIFRSAAKGMKYSVFTTSQVRMSTDHNDDGLLQPGNA